MSSAVLPDEIWLMILAHLPDASLPQLSGVNRQLTGLILNIQYKVAAAAPEELMRGEWKNPKRFIHVCPTRLPVIHRVNELVFKDDPGIVIYTIVANTYIPVYRLLPLKRLFSSSHHAQKRYFKQLLQQVKNMVNIQAVTFHFTRHSNWTRKDIHQPYVGYKIKIFRELVTTRGAQITSLSLKSNLNTIIRYWPTNVFLPNLAHLAIKVLTHHVRDTGPIFKFVHPLINRHTKSLESLDLTHARHLDLNDVLSGIDHLPALRRLGMCCFLQDTDEERRNVVRFMALHSMQLVEFDLRLLPDVPQTKDYSTTDTEAGKTVLNSFFDLPYPNLRHFSLYFQDLHPLPNQASVIRDFLQHHHHQLLSLVILPANVYTGRKLELNVTDHFQLQPGLRPGALSISWSFISFESLRNLCIYAESFDVELLAFMATSLSESLCLEWLRIEGLVSIAIPDLTPTLKSALQSWHLPDLILRGITRTTALRWSFDERYQVKRVFGGVMRISGRGAREWA
ncbi:hypothetical protein CVT24_007041, partial [Panaeolus cyanescens]